MNEPCSTPMTLPDKPPLVVHTCTMDMTHSLDGVKRGKFPRKLIVGVDKMAD